MSTLIASAILMVAPVPVNAQTSEVKEKPPMYTYVSSFAMPRPKWADLEKQNASDAKVFDKALSAGTLVAYGDDTVVVHSDGGYTHDTFWSSMSMAGVLGVLEELHKSGTTVSPVLSSATKHEDDLLVSHYYNWKSGAYKGGYLHEAFYRLKPDAPDGAIELISKSFVVPLFEKLLADGTVLEYEIDEEQIHSHAPGAFWLVYITRTAAALDKVDAAVGEAFKASALVGPALGSMVDESKHADVLSRSTGVYK